MWEKLAFTVWRGFCYIGVMLEL